jgi:hypothetical protein
VDVVVAQRIYQYARTFMNQAGTYLFPNLACFLKGLCKLCFIHLFYPHEDKAHIPRLKRFLGSLDNRPIHGITMGENKTGTHKQNGSNDCCMCKE